MKMDTQDPEVVRRPDAAEIRQRRARAAYSYEPQNEDELALKVGDELIIMGEDEEGWYQAVLHGKTGVCPSNFVELIQAEGEQMEKDKNFEKRPATPSEASKELKDRLANSLGKGSTLDKRQSTIEPPSPDKNDEGKGEIAPKKLSGVGFGNMFSKADLSQVKLKSATHAETNGKDSKDKPQVGAGQTEKKASNESKKDATNDSQVAEYAKAEFDYDAMNEDELSFSAGDIIKIITKDYVDEGWWKGEFKGKIGVFPDNFCTVIPAQPENKRPVRTPSIGKNEPEKVDKADKESARKPTAGKKTEGADVSNTASHRDKVPKSATAKDLHDDKPTADPVRDKEPEKDKSKFETSSKKPADEKDKVEKTAASTKKLETSSTRLPTSTTTVEKDKDKIEKVTKPDRPEKPTKPVVPGKKPTTASSRENTPPASDTKDSKEERTRAASSSSVLNDPLQTSTKEHEEKKEESRTTLTKNSTSPAGSAVNLRHQVPSSSSLVDHGSRGSFDSVTSLEKLVHPTASRAKGPLNRRPPSMIRPLDANNDDGNFGWGNGIDIPDSDMTLKDREPKAAEGKKLTLDVGKAVSLSRNESFKKQLESTLSAQKSPTGTVNRRVSDLSPANAVEDEVKALKEEIKSMKEDFASQIKELRDVLKTQSEKTASLEKELEKLRKDAK